MKLELLLLAVVTAIFVVIVSSSKVLRTVVRESVMRPKQPCDIHVADTSVVVVRHDQKTGKED